MNLRQKIALFTISALVLIQVLVGALFVYLHSRQLSDHSYQMISASFTALDQEMAVLRNHVSTNAYALANRKDLISSVAMISTYQDTANYRSLIFDVEKKTLSQELVKAARAARVAMIAVFTPKGELIAFAAQNEDGGYYAGIRSYDGEQVRHLVTHPNSNARYTFGDIPQLISIMPYHTVVNEHHIDYHAWRQGLFVEAGEPIQRRFPDGSSNVVGTMWVSDHLDANFAELVSRKTAQPFSLTTPNGLSIGNLTTPTDKVDVELLPFSATGHYDMGAFMQADHIDYFLGYRAVLLADDRKAIVSFGVPKSMLWSGITSFVNAAVVVLIVSSFLIFPIMMMFMNKTLITPLSRLMTGVDSLRRGEFKKLSGFEDHDELGELASSYNTMVEAIGQREEDLIQAKDEAEIANRTKSLFLANMSHELRTPLNAINGFSEMMMHKTFGELPKPYDEYADIINQSGLHLLHIIGDILDMTKVEVGKIELCEESFDPATVIQEAVDLTQTDAKAHGVTVQTDCASSCWLLADPLRLKQCVLNLLSNAYKFAQEGTVKVVTGYDDERGYFIDIIDDGIGMSSDEIGLAMQPFTQLNGDVNIARQFQGTGLGLTLTKKLVKLQGGHLTIHSEPNIGTTVTITFPIERCQHVADTVNAS